MHNVTESYNLAAVIEALGYRYGVDYVAFYLASSKMELKDYAGALQDLAVFHHLSTASPLTLKAALMEARALCESGSPAGG